MTKILLAPSFSVITILAIGVPTAGQCPPQTTVDTNLPSLKISPVKTKDAIIRGTASGPLPALPAGASRKVQVCIGSNPQGNPSEILADGTFSVVPAGVLTADQVITAQLIFTPAGGAAATYGIKDTT